MKLCIRSLARMHPLHLHGLLRRFSCRAPLCQSGWVSNKLECLHKDTSCRLSFMVGIRAEERSRFAQSSHKPSYQSQHYPNTPPNAPPLTPISHPSPIRLLPNTHMKAPQSHITTHEPHSLRHQLRIRLLLARRQLLAASSVMQCVVSCVHGRTVRPVEVALEAGDGVRDLHAAAEGGVKDGEHGYGLFILFRILLRHFIRG
jgi:hypothetical protein